MRNVSLRMTGGSEDAWRAFEQRLASRLDRIETTSNPTAVGLLLLATGMFVAPLALMAHHAPEIVRLLTDLLP